MSQSTQCLGSVVPLAIFVLFNRLWPCNCYMKCKTKRAFNILVYIVVGDDDFDILNLENSIIQVKIMTSQKNVRGDNI